jgi:hypothetical protein
MSSSGPFGLWMGMTADDFSLPLEEVSLCKFWAPEVPKPHSAFSRYLVLITPSFGLSWIKAVGPDISTSTYGIELRSAFDSMETKLTKTYGKSEISDFLIHDSVWSEPREWMQGLLNLERVLMAEWSRDTGATLAHSLASVALVVGATDTSTAYIAIEYSFENAADGEAEMAAMEDDAL